MKKLLKIYVQIILKMNFEFELNDPAVLFNQNLNIANRFGLCRRICNGVQNTGDGWLGLELNSLKKQSMCIGKFGKML